MNNNDYQALQDLNNSYGWKILKEELNNRIKQIEIILLEPDDSDIFLKITEKEKIDLISYKKMERKYLLSLLELPESLIATKINIDKNK